MTDETGRHPDVPAFDDDDLFAPLPNDAPEVSEPAREDEEPAAEPEIAEAAEPAATEEAPAPETEEPAPENGEAAAPSDESPAPAFDWGERDSLDEDELFGQIGLPDQGSSEEDTDLFDNDGPDAELPDEGFSESPAVSPFQSETEQSEESPAPQPEKKKELTDADLDVRKKYALQRIGAARVRFCCSVLFTLLLLVLECFRVFGFDVTEPLGISRIPGGAAMLDLQLILMVSYCAWRSLYAGVTALMNKRFRAEAFLLLGLAAVVWLDLDAFLRGGIGTTLASLPLAVAMTAATWAELLEWETRYRTVGLMMNRGVKYAAISSPDDEDGERLVLAPVRYVDSYDGEITSYREDSGFQFTLALLAIGVSVGAFLLVYLRSDAGIARAFSVAVSVLLLTCPFASLLSRRFWFASLSRGFLDGSTAVIGEDAAYRYAHVSTFSVEDADAFSSEETRIRIVNVFRDSRLDEILRLLSAVYVKLGGPLSRVLAETTSSDAAASDCEITEIVSGGVTARVEGKTLTVGSGEYLAQNGYSLPEVDVDKVLKNERMCVLFVAYDGDVRARFYVEYVLLRSFETRAEKLRKLGVTTEIRTFDPCITAAYFSRISYLPDEAVKIRRMAVADIDRETVRRAETGMFALGSLATTLDALHAFRRYVVARGWLGFSKFAQFLIGAALSAFFLIRFPNTPIPAWASALYCLALILLSIGRGAASEKRIAESMKNARKQERK